MAVTRDDMSIGSLVKLLAADLRADVSLPFKNQKPWHLLFYTLKKETNDSTRPSFLDDLIFDWDGPYPTCSELSDFLRGLHTTANVSAHNPSYDIITVEDDDADRWSKEKEELEDDLKVFVMRATEIAREQFGSH